MKSVEIINMMVIIVAVTIREVFLDIPSLK